MRRRQPVVVGLWPATRRLADLYRTELAAGVPVYLAWCFADALLTQRVEYLAMLVIATTVLSVPRSRRWLLGRWRAARARRRLIRGLEAVGFSEAMWGRPMVGTATATLAGHRFRVRVPWGASAADIESRAEPTAAAMAAIGVRVVRDPTNAGIADVAVIDSDPLTGPAMGPWPLSNTATTDLWRPVPVAVDEEGTPVSLSLPEHNLLLGGEPGAGKSAALSLLLAAGALDTSVKLWLLDGKQVELAAWEPCAEALVGPSLVEAIDVLENLRWEMEMRYTQLLAWRRRKVTPGDGLGLQIVACDELAFFTASGDRKVRDRVSDLLRDLVARGRAAGIIVLAATQKPAADVIPTSLRDLFGYRWALRCATREASDTVLGSGWATNGYSAADVNPATRGVGYLLHEGGIPVRLRSHYLDDQAIDTIANRARQLRHPKETS